jgi:hypothetical protein
MKRQSSGRFSDYVKTLAANLAARHGFTERRAKKLIGQSLSDPRIIALLFDHINRYITGRGDGLTLVDLAENESLKQYLKRESKESKNVKSKRPRM